MKKLLFIILFLLALVAKQTQNLLSLEITIKPLTMPYLICAAIKIKKANKIMCILLEEAFAKAKERGFECH
jgi:hypothetical protein